MRPRAGRRRRKGPGDERADGAVRHPRGGRSSRHALEQVVTRFEECEAALGPVYDASQIFADPHFRARESLVTVPDPVLGALTLCNVVPRLSATPGAIAWLGPALGVHNEDVYCGRLGLGRAELEGLRARGVV